MIAHKAQPRPAYVPAPRTQKPAKAKCSAQMIAVAMTPCPTVITAEMEAEALASLGF